MQNISVRLLRVLKTTSVQTNAEKVQRDSLRGIRYRYHTDTLPGGPSTEVCPHTNAVDATPAKRLVEPKPYSLRRLLGLRFITPIPQPVLEQADVHLLGEFAL